MLVNINLCCIMQFMDSQQAIPTFFFNLFLGNYHEYTCFVDAENPELESVLEDLRIDCCTKYYRSLLAEYEYLTSDSAIYDYLTNCDWLKYTKNGVNVN